MRVDEYGVDRSDAHAADTNAGATPNVATAAMRFSAALGTSVVIGCFWVFVATLVARMYDSPVAFTLVNVLALGAAFASVWLAQPLVTRYLPRR